MSPEVWTIVGVLAALWVVFFGSKTLPDWLKEMWSIILGNKPSTAALPLSPVSEQELLTAYLNRVRISHLRLRFGDPSASVLLPEGAKEGSRLALRDVYTPLYVATEFSSIAPTASDVRPAQLSLSVDEALRHIEARRTVVLGDPGSGKSTLVDHLIAQACADGKEMPVHVRLTQIDVSESGSFWTGVYEAGKATERGSSEPEMALISAVERRLRDAPSLIIFDGLDEVPEKLVASAVNEILRVAETFSNARIVVTCRPYDYDLERPNRKLPFTKLRLLPFRESDMLDYVDKWYSALARLEYIADAPARKRNLQDALRNSSELSSLASTPLLLTLMALIHTTEGELPKARAILFHRTASHLLSDSPQWRRTLGAATVATSDVLPLAQRLAFEIHQRDDQAGKPISGIAAAEIEKIVKAHVGVSDRVDNVPLPKLRAQREQVDLLVDRLINSNGLLSQTSLGQYNFSHKSLKEFLAGMHFLNLSNLELTRKMARSQHWREPIILMAGYGGREGNALYFLSKLIEAIIKDSSNLDLHSLYLKTLAGEMLAEIGAETLRMRGQAWVFEGDGSSRERKKALWNQVVDLLFDAHRGADTIDRIKTLQVLGRLGDPRLVTPSDDLIPVTSRVSFLPQALVKVGDDDPGRPKEKSSLVTTVPIRTVEIRAMHVSTFPVTNREFHDFVEDKGYERHEFWPPNGQRWLNGAREFGQKLLDTTRQWIERDFGPEIERGKFRLSDVLRDAAEMSKPRREPFYWRNARYNAANQPVVGVNLWEAMAYCSWLRGRLLESQLISENVEVGLPSEWEWERCARGTKARAIYPWGDDPPGADHAHTRADGLALDFATPVGCFPLGRTDHQVLDVVGNVWEWTVSRAFPPEDQWDHLRAGLDDVADVVVRGGSWFSNEPMSIRCGYRGIDLPQNVYYDVGFRVFLFGHKPTSRSVNHELQAISTVRN